MKEKKKLGLVPKLIIAIILGILIGQFLPEEICRIVVTLSGLFSSFLKFVIPLMILAYVTMGIADLSQGAGKLLLCKKILDELDDILEKMVYIQFGAVEDFLELMVAAQAIPHTDLERYPSVRKKLKERAEKG